MIKFSQKVIKKIAYIFSAVAILFLWHFLSLKINSNLILPKPFEVLKTVVQLCFKSEFWIDFLFTFWRSIFAFLISCVFGFFLGFICAKFVFFKYFFEFPLQIIRTTPVIALILIALFWFNSNFLPVFAAVLMSLPIVTTCVQKGFLSVNKKEMFTAKIFNVSKIKCFFYIEFPTCLPFFINSVDSVFGLCWKVVVAAEVMCLPKAALGKIMINAQINLETSKVLVITALLVLVSFILQMILKGVLKKICKTL